MTTHTQILAAGLVCAAGSDLNAASAALSTGERFVKQDRGLVGPDGFAIRTAYVIPIDQEPDYFFRIYSLFEDAFVQCERRLAELGIESRLPLTLLLPAFIRSSEAEEWFSTEILDRLGSKVSSVQFAYGGAAEGLVLLGEYESSPRYVAAVDSAISADVIDMLIAQRRLYTIGNPWGVIPGEGAAVLAVGTAVFARAEVVRIRQAFEAVRPEDPERGIIGRAMAEAMREVVADGPAPIRFLADLDGSRSSTEEFGLAVTASGPKIAALADRVQTLMPQIGYTGSASGIILVALVSDGEEPSLICASDPCGTRSCVLIGTPEDTRR